MFVNVHVTATGTAGTVNVPDNAPSTYPNPGAEHVKSASYEPTPSSTSANTTRSPANTVIDDTPTGPPTTSTSESSFTPSIDNDAESPTNPSTHTFPNDNTALRRAFVNVQVVGVGVSGMVRVPVRSPGV